MQPLIKRATMLRKYRLGPNVTGLYGNIESAGSMQYSFILAVQRDTERQPFVFVTSEVSVLAHAMGPSHVLGIFEGDRHVNMGFSDEWADLEHFTMRALEIAAGYVGVTDPPKLTWSPPEV